LGSESSFFSRTGNDSTVPDAEDDSTVDAALVQSLFAAGGENAEPVATPASSSKRSSARSRRSSTMSASDHSAAMSSPPNASSPDLQREEEDDGLPENEEASLASSFGRSKRARSSKDRQTASPAMLASLVSMLGEFEDEDEDAPSNTKKLKISDLEPTEEAPAKETEQFSVQSPATTSKSSRGKTPLRSCLSARKASRLRTSRVVFGSPQTAEFRRNSPAAHWTPVPKSSQSRTVAVAEAPEETSPQTAKNDDLLAKWEEADGTPTKIAIIVEAEEDHKHEDETPQVSDQEEDAMGQASDLPRRSPRLAKGPGRRMSMLPSMGRAKGRSDEAPRRASLATATLDAGSNFWEQDDDDDEQEEEQEAPRESMGGMDSITEEGSEDDDDMSVDRSSYRQSTIIRRSSVGDKTTLSAGNTAELAEVARALGSSSVTTDDLADVTLNGFTAHGLSTKVLANVLGGTTITPEEKEDATLRISQLGKSTRSKRSRSVSSAKSDLTVGSEEERTIPLGTLTGLLEHAAPESLEEEPTAPLGTLTGLLRDQVDERDEEEETTAPLGTLTGLLRDQVDERDEEEEALLEEEARLLRESGVPVDEADRRRSRESGRRSSRPVEDDNSSDELDMSLSKRSRFSERTDAGQIQATMAPVTVDEACQHSRVPLPPTGEGAFSVSVLEATRTAMDRFESSDVAVWAHRGDVARATLDTATSTASLVEAKAHRITAALVVGSENAALDWAASQLADQHQALAEQLTEFSNTVQRQAAEDHSCSGPLFVNRLTSSSTRGAWGRLHELGAASSTYASQYVEGWAAEVQGQVCLKLRDLRGTVRASAAEVETTVGALREALEQVKAEITRVSTIRAGAEQDASNALKAKALAEEASKTRAQAARLIAASQDAEERRSSIARRIAAMRADIERLEREAVDASVDLVPVASGDAVDGKPTSAAVLKAKTAAAKFSALSLSTPWRVVESAGGAEGGRWKVSMAHFDGSNHSVSFTLGPAVEVPMARSVSEWTVESDHPPKSGVGAPPGAEAFLHAVFSRGAEEALALVKGVSGAAGVRPALARAGALLRQRALLAARCVDALQSADVSADGPSLVLRVTSMAARCRVAVHVPFEAVLAIEAPLATETGRTGWTEADGVSVNVELAAGLLDASDLASAARFALTSLAPGYGSVKRAGVQVRRALEKLLLSA
jgi:hypothetical protein